MNDLLFRSAAELASLVRDGEVTATELVDASLERIEVVDREVNAFTRVYADEARALAGQVGPGDTRPFAGVPIALKDIAASKGMRLTAGSDLFGEFTPDYDAHVIRRLKEAGFVPVGTASTPEMGILPVTEPRRFGPTRNPWDLARTPGGSSGGSAAAVAAGMVPLAHGSDGGGSIRIPAACCGLVGLKPSRGRISRGPESGDDMLVQDAVLTRTVAETAELLDLLHGYEPGDATWAPPPSEPYARAAARDPERLRIGMTMATAVETEVHPESQRAAREAAELLSELGHEVTEIESPPWAEGDLLPVFMTVFGSHISTAVVLGGVVTGREPTEELVEPLTWQIFDRARSMGGMDYLLARLQLQALSRQIIALWSGFDVMLTPALAERPVPIGEIDPCGDEPWEAIRRAGRFTPYTAIFNVTGTPGISVPLLQGDDGMPLAVQLVGPPAREDLLISLAGQLERARPWADRVAPVAAGAGAG
jgi:amidase